MIVFGIMERKMKGIPNSKKYTQIHKPRGKMSFVYGKGREATRITITRALLDSSKK